MVQGKISTSSDALSYLGHGGKAVGGARSVGHHVHVGGVAGVVDAHHEHGRVAGRGADHHLYIRYT